MKTAFTEYIAQMKEMRDNTPDESLRTSLSWHIQDVERFEKYCQLVRAVQPELHRNALLYCGFITLGDDD